MLKKLAFLSIFVSIFTGAAFAARQNVSDYIAPAQYENMRPFMNNTMRVGMDPGTMPNYSQNQTSLFVRDSGEGRRVVARGAAAARSGTTGTNSARNATGSVPQTGNTAQTQRRVVTRTNSTARSAIRNDITSRTDAASPNTNVESISSDRCFADYTTCMNDYCERKNSEYNKCYCSSRLAQIDSEYKPAIDSIVRQILELGSKNTWTNEEMKDYWGDIMGQHTGDNTWESLDNILDIDWADSESRVRGQQAFITGHDYCVQHLRSCYYMSANLRDAYRSEIARDCLVYEHGLQKLKNTAESALESMKK